MSENLAQLIETDDERIKRQKETLQNLMDTDSTLSKEKFEERVRKAREGKYIPKRVTSWGELWDNY